MTRCSSVRRAALPVLLLMLLLLLAGPAAARAFAVQKVPLTFFDGTEADVYVWDIPPGLTRWLEDAFPIVVLLQGALVDKSNYSEFATHIARAGYTVVVPNRTRTLPAPDGTLVTGLFADVQAITESIEALIAEDALAQSPLYRIVDTADIATVGHSFGGGAVIDAAAGVCAFPFCSEDTFERPDGLRVSVVYGASRLDLNGEPLPRDTTGVGVALIQGTNDGIAAPEKADATLPEMAYPHALINLPGANHYALCNTAQPLPPAPTEPNPSELEQEDAIRLVADWTLKWLDVTRAQQ